MRTHNVMCVVFGMWYLSRPDSTECIESEQYATAETIKKKQQVVLKLLVL